MNMEILKNESFESNVRTLPTLKEGVVNATAIRALATSNQTAEAILMDLACRERHTNKTDFIRHKMSLRREGFKIVDNDYEHAMEALEEAGAGKVVYPRGKSKNPPYFAWTVNMKAVGRMAFNEETILVKRQEKQEAKEVVTKRGPGRPRKLPVFLGTRHPVVQTSHTFYIQLSDDRLVEVSVPGNLSANEARLISNVIEKNIK